MPTYVLTSGKNFAACKECPTGAKYCEGSTILLEPGYWRENELSDHIIYCENKPSLCVGEEKGSINYCSNGHIGPLCETCDAYGKVKYL
jgi:hypothetical protein